MRPVSVQGCDQAGQSSLGSQAAFRHRFDLYQALEEVSSFHARSRWNRRVGAVRATERPDKVAWTGPESRSAAGKGCPTNGIRAPCLSRLFCHCRRLRRSISLDVDTRQSSVGSLNDYRPKAGRIDTTSKVEGAAEAAPKHAPAESRLKACVVAVIMKPCPLLRSAPPAFDDTL